MGGTPAYTYLWNLTGQTTSTATGLWAGNYTVTVTDANGCTAITSVTINQPPAVVANPTVTNAGCGLSDGSITLAPSGGTPGYTYTWLPIQSRLELKIPLPKPMMEVLTVICMHNTTPK